MSPSPLGVPVADGSGTAPRAPRVLGEADLLRWSESLAAIAQTALGFTDSAYERERYEEILAVAADIRVAAGSPFSAEDQVQEWLRSVGEGVSGYHTPKVTVGAVVSNDRGEILLIQRADSGVWLYPTGWADVGYSAAEVAVKEVAEETGIDCEVTRVLAVLDGLRLGFTRIPLYSVVFHCQAVGGELCPHPLECTDVGWFARDQLPEPLAGYDHWGPLVWPAVDGAPLDVHYDEPRRPPWQAPSD